MSSINMSGTLGSSVAVAGTFTATLPARPGPEYGNHNAGDVLYGVLHELYMGQQKLSWPKDFSFSISGTTVTITNKTSAAWAAATDWRLGLDIPGTPIYRSDKDFTSGVRDVRRAARVQPVWVSLGAPAANSANGIATSQSVGAAASFNLNGSLVSGGAVVLDTPRNIVAAWTNTSTVTVFGFDEYGNAMTETSGSGTSFTGKKAFAKVTGVTSSASITGATVGTGNVLGLPMFLPGTGHVVRELQDGAAPTAGTIVAGDTTSGGSTATTGDVRGTYTPNATPDGSKKFALLLMLMDPQFLGMAQA